MPISPSSLATPTWDVALTLDRVAAWEVYRRLQELSIPCRNSVHQPLMVTIATPHTLAQVWSVVKTQTDSRADHIAHLHRCWQQRISK